MVALCVPDFSAAHIPHNPLPGKPRGSPVYWTAIKGVYPAELPFVSAH